MKLPFLLLILVVLPFLRPPLLAAPPSWFVSPPESSEQFYFLSSSSSTDQAEARQLASRKLVVDASSYLGKHFDRAKLETMHEAFDKDIASEVYICYMIASYPRGDAAAREFQEAWRVRQINRLFSSSVKKSQNLAQRDRIIEAITTLSAAKADPLLPDVKKDELDNMMKELAARVRVRPLEYPRAGNTASELRGDLGVLLVVAGRTDQPVSGLNVDFAFVRNAGNIEPSSAMTDRKGLAAVKVKRLNRPGEAVIEASVSSRSVPEFAYIAPAQFQIDVSGTRVEIMKSALPVRRGGVKKQNIALLEDNLPVGVISIDLDLKPGTLLVSAKLVPTRDLAGFIVDKQAHVDGVSVSEISKTFPVAVENVREGASFSVELAPFEIILSPQRIQREKIKLPLGGEQDTIQQLLLNYVLLYQ